MTEEQADAITKAVWGSKGKAWVNRRFTGHEKPGEDGWVRAAGPIYSYNVGYTRKGKRGAILTTLKGSSETGFLQALNNALGEMTQNQELKADRLREELLKFEGQVSA